MIELFYKTIYEYLRNNLFISRFFVFFNIHNDNQSVISLPWQVALEWYRRVCALRLSYLSMSIVLDGD